MKKFVFLALILALFASTSYAGLILNVRQDGTTGNEPIIVDHVGQTVVFDIYATFGQTDGALNSPLIKVINVGVRANEVGGTAGVSTPGLYGNISALLADKTSTTGSVGATHVGYDGVLTSAGTTHGDWGGTQPGNSATGFWVWSNSAGVGLTNGEVYLGKMTWTCTEANQGTVDLYAFPATKTTGAGNGYSYSDDGVGFAGGNQYTQLTATGHLGIGQHCTINVVPEPSTFVLLGLGALALVFIRRRK
jgi:hypothetical protein